MESVYNSIVATGADLRAPIVKPTYRTFLSLNWAFQEGRVAELEATGEILPPCPPCGKAPCLVVWDGVRVGTDKDRLPSEVLVRPEDVCHPQALSSSSTGPRAAQLLLASVRKDIRAFIDSLPAGKALLSGDLPHFDYAPVNDLLAAFNLGEDALLGVATKVPFAKVRQLLFDLSMPSSVHAFFNGVSFDNARLLYFDFAIELKHSSPSMPRIIALLESLRDVHFYAYDIAYAFFCASFLPTRVAALRAFFIIMTDLTNVIVSRPVINKTPTHRQSYCTECDPSTHAFTYCAAIRRVDKSGIDRDALMLREKLEPYLHAQRQLATSRRPVSALDNTAVTTYGSFGLLLGGWSTHKLAEKAILEIAVLLLPLHFELCVVWDDHDKVFANAEGAEGEIWSSPFVRPACIHHNDPVDTDDAEKKGCTRKDDRRSNGKQGPGIITGVCIHGLFNGISVLRRFESARLVAQAIHRHFPFMCDLFYDMGCTCFEQFIHRDPYFVSGAAIVLDRLHKWNHVACNHTFRPENHPTLKGKNSQAAEQVNSTLRKLKSFVPYQTFRHFVTFMKLFAHMHNKRRIVKA
jgi:hypothetical protein